VFSTLDLTLFLTGNILLNAKRIFSNIREDVDCIQLAFDRIQGNILVNKVMNHRFP
jgi:hypothetical protein